MFKITGYTKREGEYNGHAYSNYSFDFMHNENSAYVGYSTSFRGIKSLNISTKKLVEICGVDSPDKLVGKNVDVRFEPGFEGKIKIGSITILPDNK